MRVLASFSLHHLDIPAIYIDLGLYSPFMSVAATFMGLANHRTWLPSLRTRPRRTGLSRFMVHSPTYRTIWIAVVRYYAFR